MFYIWEDDEDNQVTQISITSYRDEQERVKFETEQTIAQRDLSIKLNEGSFHKCTPIVELMHKNDEITLRRE